MSWPVGHSDKRVMMPPRPLWRAPWEPEWASRCQDVNFSFTVGLVYGFSLFSPLKALHGESKPALGLGVFMQDVKEGETAGTRHYFPQGYALSHPRGSWRYLSGLAM